MSADDFEEMFKSGSGGKEEGKARQQATGDGFGRTRGQQSEW
jgi:hypothetical protein